MLQRSEAYPALLAKKLHGRRPEFSSDQRERGGRHHPRRLGTVASPFETQNRYLHSGTRNQRCLPRPAGRSNPKQSSADHRQGESAKPECARCDRRDAVTKLRERTTTYLRLEKCSLIWRPRTTPRLSLICCKAWRGIRP